MTEKPLHVRVAEALGWTECSLKDTFGAFEIFKSNLWGGIPPAHMGELLRKRYDDGLTSRLWPIPRYDTDWSATGPLIEKYKIGLVPRQHDWMATHGLFGWDADTPLSATCLALIELGRAGRL